MGIYISDLEIPKDKAVQIVIIRDDWICVDEWGNTYGVVSPPPHGRLIDADELKKEFPHDSDWDYPVNTHESVCEAIDNAPTIIKAEEGE